MSVKKTIFLLGILFIVALIIWQLISPSEPRLISEPTIGSTVESVIETIVETRYDSGSWRTIIPETCNYFFDGCNTCQRDEVGLKCTQKACREYKKPKCLE